MGGAVYGLVAMIAVVMLAKRLGYEWREAGRKLWISAAFFVLTLFFQGVLNEGGEGAAFLGLCSAALGWFLLALSVFDIADPDEAPQAD